MKLYDNRLKGQMSEFPGGHLETGKISVKMTTCLFGTLPNQKQCHEIRMALQQPFFSSLLGGRMHSSGLGILCITQVQHFASRNYSSIVTV